MSSSRHPGAPLLGAALVLLGLLLLLDNLDVWEVDVGHLISTYWPLLLVYVAGRHLLQRRLLAGVLFLAAGIVLQLAALDLLRLRTLGRLWPLALVGLGAWLVLQSLRRPAAGEPAGKETGDTFRIFQILGGANRVVASRAFRGGEATAFMAGIEIDLRGADLAPGGARIDVTAVMAGVELRLPESWEVVVSGTPFLGGIEDARGPRKPAETPSPKLEIRATVLMGGLEIQ